MYRARVLPHGDLRIIANNRPDLPEGEIVFVTIEHGRSEASHRHQFAWIKDAWSTLPESLMFEDWAATPETMRKRALIECGFYEQVIVDCGEDKTARDVAKEIGKARRAAHGYAVAAVRGSVAVIRWPESQTYRAMGSKRFQESKTAILDWIAGKLGVSPDELRRAAA